MHKDTAVDLLDGLNEVLSLLRGHNVLSQDGDVGVFVRAVLADQTSHVALDFVADLLQDLSKASSIRNQVVSV